MIKQIDEKSLSSARIYCQICLVGCEAKHQARRKLEKNSEISNSRVYVEKLKSKNHKYDKAFDFVDWKNNDSKYAHKSCNGFFVKDSYLNSQSLITATPKNKVKPY